MKFLTFRKPLVVDDGEPAPPTIDEQIKALTERVKQLEKDTQVHRPFPFSYNRLFLSYFEETKRPKVGEAVRLLMEHLGLEFKAGDQTPDKLLPKKKPAKKK